ncbi:MAG: outer membrane beta-barrel protein [Gammaproteobacteria bacterium]|nr:outer membrane beta-barrel protein [Gammaproteobacteria bacterium]
MKNILVAWLLAFVAMANVSADSDTRDWTLRLGAANVNPNESSSTVLGNDGVAVDDAWGLGISFDLVLAERWGLEILAATPFTHTLSGTGSLSGLEIGKVKHLPPTFSALYYLNDEQTWHVGLGINYTTFLKDEASDALVQTLMVGSADLELDDSVGYSVKVGFDYPINDAWSFNGNLYYMNIETTADIILDGAYFGSVDVDINPYVVMLGVSTKF